MLSIARRCVPFTPFDKDLSTATVTLVSATGVYSADTEAFPTVDPGDVSYRTIAGSADLSSLRIAHHHYDHTEADADPNIVFPLETLRALVEEGVIAAANEKHYSYGFTTRLRARIMRYVAESIAEQRLLWQLRGRAEAALVYPDDLTEAHAREILRRQLNRDFERHRFWLAIDSIGLVASGALMLLPGPNVVAYYFVFRIVGHFLSVRGARQGLAAVTWRTQASTPLSALRGMVGIAPDARADRVDEVATTLRLEHFAAFFQRTAIP